MEPSLHCIQFHQKLASSWAQVVEVFSRVRELENRISKISIFFKVTQDICYSNSTCLLSLFSSNQRKRVGRKERERKRRRRGPLNPRRPPSHQGGRRPGTPQQAVSAGLSRLRQRRQKAPSGGYQETLGLKRGSWEI